MTAATEAERRRLQETFAALCRDPEPVEKRAPLRRDGHRPPSSRWPRGQRGRAGDTLGGDCGNLLARIPGSGEETILLCAHLDTVPLAAAIEPVLRDGFWENANEAILGADNKAAVAVLLVLAERLAAAPAGVGIELLFTVGEERALSGAKEFEAGVLRSRVGFAFDSAAPVGGVVVSSPTHYRVAAELHGVAAHAGLRPENGRSAILAAARAIAGMRLGRIDSDRHRQHRRYRRRQRSQRCSRSLPRPRGSAQP